MGVSLDSGITGKTGTSEFIKLSEGSGSSRKLRQLQILESLTGVDSDVVLDYNSTAYNSFADYYPFLWENLAQFDSPGTTDPQSIGPLYTGFTAATAAADPVFTGAYGYKGSYFAHNGSQFFTYTGQTSPTAPGVADGCWANLHKTTGGQAFAFGWFGVLGSLASIQTLMSTKAASLFAGMSIFVDTNGKLNATQRYGTAAGNVVTKTSTAAVTAGVPTTLWVSCDGSNVRMMIGSTYETQAMAFGATTDAPTAPMSFGATFDSTVTTPSLILTNLSKTYAITMCDAFKTQAQMEALIAETRKRCGVNF